MDFVIPEGDKKYWEDILRACPRDVPEGYFPTGMIKSIIFKLKSLTPDNDILHQFKNRSAVGMKL